MANDLDDSLVDAYVAAFNEDRELVADWDVVVADGLDAKDSPR